MASGSRSWRTGGGVCKIKNTWTDSFGVPINEAGKVDGFAYDEFVYYSPIPEVLGAFGEWAYEPGLIRGNPTKYTIELEYYHGARRPRDRSASDWESYLSRDRKEYLQKLIWMHGQAKRYRISPW